MNYSRITDHLYLGTTPGTRDYEILRGLGIGLVINMRIERPPHPDRHDPPLPVLWIPTCDTPLIPIPLRALHRGVQAALGVIHSGGIVYGHCAQGVHRAVALGSAILIALGYSPEEAMALIKDRRIQADPHAWHIRRQIERFGQSWQGLWAGNEA